MIFMEYDVFICHASEDKKSCVEPLANTLRETGLNVWYDRFALKLGDSLREKIDQGLANSRYGVVVLSQVFFSKEWPTSELDALVTRQNNEGKKVVLPIWHGVGVEEVKKFSPILASKVSARSADGIEAVVNQICEVVNEVDSKPRSVFEVGQNFGLREQCLEIIRQNDIVAWRKLIKEKTQNIPEQLKTWKKAGKPAANKGGQEWESAVIDAAKICVPGFIPIFAAIEAGKKDFWKESLGILRRLAVLENEMGGGAVWALRIGSYMLYIVGTIGMAIAANLKLLDLINEWMQVKMPDKCEGELPWFRVCFAHHLPDGIFNTKEPFSFIKTFCNMAELKNFFPGIETLVDNILAANLLCSLIELRICSQNQKDLDALMGDDNFYFDVWPIWCLMPVEKFRNITLELFGDRHCQ